LFIGVQLWPYSFLLYPPAANRIDKRAFHNKKDEEEITVPRLDIIKPSAEILRCYTIPTAGKRRRLHIIYKDGIIISDKTSYNDDGIYKFYLLFSEIYAFFFFLMVLQQTELMVVYIKQQPFKGNNRQVLENEAGNLPRYLKLFSLALNSLLFFVHPFFG
jgi:hypothetical protein